MVRRRIAISPAVYLFRRSFLAAKPSAPPVITMGADTAGGEVKVIEGGAWREADAAAGGDDAAREVALESIGGADEVLVESADGERARAHHR